MSTDSPGFSVCSVKQKHSIFMKYLPASSGETLNTAVPVTLAAAWFTALFKASCFPPIGTVTAVFSGRNRSEEHTSELQSLMSISDAVFCLKKKNAQGRTHLTL